MFVEIMIYVTVIIILFGYGGRMAEFSTMRIPMNSFGDIAKICSIVYFLLLTAIFIQEQLFLMQNIRIYWVDRKSFWVI